MASLDYFKHNLCITLPERRDRRTAVEREFRRVGIKQNFFPATHWKTVEQEAVDRWRALYPSYRLSDQNIKAYTALSRSLVRAVTFAQGRQWPRLVIFEDDALFHPDFVQLWKDIVVPLAADFVGLGCIKGTGLSWGKYRSLSRRRKEVCVQGNWYRPKLIMMGQAFVLESSLFSAIKRVWTEDIGQNDVVWNVLWDDYYAVYHVPPIVAQQAGYSDLANRKANYYWLQKTWREDK